MSDSGSRATALVRFITPAPHDNDELDIARAGSWALLVRALTWLCIRTLDSRGAAAVAAVHEASGFMSARVVLYASGDETIIHEKKEERANATHSPSGTRQHYTCCTSPLAHGLCL